MIMDELLTNDAVRSALLKVLREILFEMDGVARGALHALVRIDAARNTVREMLDDGHGPDEVVASAVADGRV
jgi:hypothetical protein